MATVDVQTHHTGRGPRSSSVAGRHHGRGSLAEVIVIHPVRQHRVGFLGSLVTTARAFASLRPQAAPVRSTPRPPTSPASRGHAPDSRPDDAA